MFRNSSRNIINEADKEIRGMEDQRTTNWFNEECQIITGRKNRAYLTCRGELQTTIHVKKYPLP